MLLGIVFFALGFNGGPVAFLVELGNLVALAMNATALGLSCRRWSRPPRRRWR